MKITCVATFDMPGFTDGGKATRLLEDLISSGLIHDMDNVVVVTDARVGLNIRMPEIVAG